VTAAQRDQPAGTQAAPGLVVERCYEPDTACAARALLLLLHSPAAHRATQDGAADEPAATAPEREGQHAPR
jgi:hypothetical protein